MNLERFLREREPDWGVLEGLLDRAGGRVDRLGPDGVLDLGRRYRAAAADLALARRSFSGDPVVIRLETLVARGRALVYAETTESRETVTHFLLTGYWRRVRERPVPLLVAALLLLVPALLGTLWGADDPGAAIGVVPGDFRGEGAASGDVGLGAAQQAEFASKIFTNNLQVTFLAFAGGVLAGLGTAAVLIYNGVLLGAIAGISIEAGRGSVFAELVVPHGVLELTCIAVCAAAGLRIGWALVEPGSRPRGQALASEARRSIEVVLGTAPWIVLAGLVEGFVTGTGLGLGAALAIGLGLGGLWWGLLAWRGAPVREPAARGTLPTAARGTSP